MSDIIPENTKKLGFGLMRLPRKRFSMDLEQIKTMVDMFMEAGFTYFDTAHIYPQSEDTIRKALVDRYPRESYTIATKLFAMAALTEKKARAQLDTSLKRMNIDYVDYYLLHSIMEMNKGRYDKFHLWDYVNEMKAEGKIKHIGFSFHAGPKLLDRLLTDHPEVEFVQLQINYADWENPKISSRANYEVARKHGKAITIMEPVKGGALANPPKEVQELFSSYHKDMSYPSWAIRFAASLDGVISVLSGMSNTDQMRDNLSYMKDFVPLNEEEQEIIRKAQRIMKYSSTVPCTSCRYCIEGCPMKINIPGVFSAMNLHLGNGQMDEAKERYAKVTEGAGLASDCIKCRKCEETCPQHLEITDNLEKAVSMFE